MNENFRFGGITAGGEGSPASLPAAEDRILEAAERVHHLEILGLLAGEDAAVGEAHHVLPLELAAAGHRPDELAVHVVEQRLQHAPLVGGHGAAGVAEILELPSLHDDVVHADLLHELLEVGHAA